MAAKNEQEVLRDILGLDVDIERQAEVIAAFGDILREIEKLRTLDLSDVHPAIVFSPLVFTQDAPPPPHGKGKADA